MVVLVEFTIIFAKEAMFVLSAINRGKQGERQSEVCQLAGYVRPACSGRNKVDDKYLRHYPVFVLEFELRRRMGAAIARA